MSDPPCSRDIDIREILQTPYNTVLLYDSIPPFFCPLPVTFFLSFFFSLCLSLLFWGRVQVIAHLVYHLRQSIVRNRCRKWKKTAKLRLAVSTSRANANPLAEGEYAASLGSAAVTVAACRCRNSYFLKDRRRNGSWIASSTISYIVFRIRWNRFPLAF